MQNKEIIEAFYSAFSRGDWQEMGSYYHNEVTFSDPVFGELRSTEASKMWKMLLSRKDASPKITFANVKANDQEGSADWQAEYFYGPKKRKVINKINAEFTFEGGKIIKHKDSFDLWTWSKQALGPMGYLLGWSPFMKGKIRKMARGRLDNF